MEHILLEQLRERPMLCDGAMGTLLYARGVSYERCFDALNVTQPDLIQGIYQEYISAGAQIIETNTFGANRAKLEAYNLADRVREINLHAVKLAREAREVTGQHVFIAGAVGPTERPLHAPDEHRLSEIRTIFREQIGALVDGGADLLILETFSNLAELRQAVLAAQEAAAGLPIVLRGWSYAVRSIGFAGSCCPLKYGRRCDGSELQRGACRDIRYIARDDRGCEAA